MQTHETGAGAYAATMTAEFEAALRAFVDGVASHQQLVDYAVGAGHRTRPVGCLLSCAAVGANWREALEPAVGVELLHKSSVIRDDIADGDQMRSGQRAFHVAHGTASAIAVSDVLLTLGLDRIFSGAPRRLADVCLRAATECLREMAAGQLEDIFPTDGRRDIDDRLIVEEQKTGSLAGLACRLGATIGGGTPEQIASLTDYGRKIGTAFQVLNDVRNLNGEEFARSAGSDVRKRRDTVLSAYAREVATSKGSPVPSLPSLDTGDLCQAEAEAVREYLLASGVVEFGENLSSRLLEEARAHLRALPPTPALATLDALTRGMLRDHAF